jgi:hypothetical protein
MEGGAEAPASEIDEDPRWPKTQNLLDFEDSVKN